MEGYRSGTAMALLAALGVALSAAQATAQQMSGCDQDSDGYVSADEAAACAERDYSTMVGDEEAISRERFEQAFPATEDVDEMWAEADVNQDGQLSQAEWADWSAQRFRSASTRIEGMSVDDYEALEAQYHLGDDQQGQDESRGGGSDNAGATSTTSGSGGDGSGGGSGNAGATSTTSGGGSDDGSDGGSDDGSGGGSGDGSDGGSDDGSGDGSDGGSGGGSDGGSGDSGGGSGG